MNIENTLETDSRNYETAASNSLEEIETTNDSSLKHLRVTKPLNEKTLSSGTIDFTHLDEKLKHESCNELKSVKPTIRDTGNLQKTSISTLQINNDVEVIEKISEISKDVPEKEKNDLIEKKYLLRIDKTVGNSEISKSNLEENLEEQPMDHKASTNDSRPGLVEQIKALTDPQKSNNFESSVSFPNIKSSEHPEKISKTKLQGESVTLETIDVKQNVIDSDGNLLEKPIFEIQKNQVKNEPEKNSILKDSSHSSKPIDKREKDIFDVKVEGPLKSSKISSESFENENLLEQDNLIQNNDKNDLLEKKVEIGENVRAYVKDSNDKEMEKRSEQNTRLKNLQPSQKDLDSNIVASKNGKNMFEKIPVQEKTYENEQIVCETSEPWNETHAETLEKVQKVEKPLIPKNPSKSKPFENLIQGKTLSYDMPMSIKDTEKNVLEDPSKRPKTSIKHDDFDSDDEFEKDRNNKQNVNNDVSLDDSGNKNEEVIRNTKKDRKQNYKDNQSCSKKDRKILRNESVEGRLEKPKDLKKELEELDNCALKEPLKISKNNLEKVLDKFPISYQKTSTKYDDFDSENEFKKDLKDIQSENVSVKNEHFPSRSGTENEGTITSIEKKNIDGEQDYKDNNQSFSKININKINNDYVQETVEKTKEIVNHNSKQLPKNSKNDLKKASENFPLNCQINENNSVVLSVPTGGWFAVEHVNNMFLLTQANIWKFKFSRNLKRLHVILFCFTLLEKFFIVSSVEYFHSLNKLSSEILETLDLIFKLQKISEV